MSPEVEQPEKMLHEVWMSHHKVDNSSLCFSCHIQDPNLVDAGVRGGLVWPESPFSSYDRA